MDTIADRILVDCRKTLSATNLANAKSVDVRHVVRGTNRQKIVAPADQDMPLQVGHRVYLHMNDCSKRLVRAATTLAKVICFSHQERLFPIRRGIVTGSTDCYVMNNQQGIAECCGRCISADWTT